MSISTKCAEALIGLYKAANRIGLLESKIIKSLYISSYFTYKKHIEDSFARLTKNYGSLFKNGNILDVGANIGYTCFVFSKAIDDAFKIFAFEPEEKNIKTLEKVANKYKFSHSLVPVAAAVGNHNGEIELWQNDAHNGDHRILTQELKNQLKGQITVQKTKMVTIDDYLKKFGDHFPISFIKIDVQGYELAVCEGMVNTLAKNPDTVIGFEYCPSIIESLGFKPEKLLQFFQDKGYQFYFLNKKDKIEKYDVEQGNALLRQIRPHDYIDLLCARKNLITA